MPSVDLAALAAGALLGLAPLAVAAGRWRQVSGFIYGASGALCAVLMLTGLLALIGNGPDTALTLPLGLPWLGVHLRLDALSAFFLVVLGIGGGVTSLYAIGYGRHEHEPHRVLPFYPAFLGAMALVLLADDAFTFLMCWEIMSLMSWALVLTHHREAATREAGFVYLVMAGFGTMVLLLAFGLLAGTDGSYAFEAIRAVERTPAKAAVILTLMLVGAGSKAGLVPLHVWLPLAHPAAPSHVSALMSGVMTKVAIYGFIRVVFDLLGPVAEWTSPAVILLGAVTAVLGILFATMDGDAKRVLAYSTIENIGVIFAALGLALAFRANGMPALAALAFSAALFHVFNHMLFKSLLFMGAGAVLTATGRRDLDGLGGLIHRMPVTALPRARRRDGDLGAAAAQRLRLGVAAVPGGAAEPRTAAVGAAAAGAGGGRDAGSVRRAGGGLFRALLRGRVPRAAADPGGGRRPSTSTAFPWRRWRCWPRSACLRGSRRGRCSTCMAPAVSAMLDGRLPPQIGQPWLTLVPIAESRSTYSGLLVLLFIAFGGSASAWLVHRYASRALRRGPAWDCGFPQADPMTQYGAGSFAQPLRRVLGTTLMQAREEVDMPEPGDPRPAHYRVHTADLVWQGLYVPIAAGVGTLATRLNGLQFLTIRRYLSLVFLSLILLLLGLTLWT